MDVWVVYQYWQNLYSDQVIAIYRHEKDAKDRVEMEEIINDEANVGFNYECVEVFEGRDIVRDREVAML